VFSSYLEDAPASAMPPSLVPRGPHSDAFVRGRPSIPDPLLREAKE